MPAPIVLAVTSVKKYDAWLRSNFSTKWGKLYNELEIVHKEYDARFQMSEDALPTDEREKELSTIAPALAAIRSEIQVRIEAGHQIMAIAIDSNYCCDFAEAVFNMSKSFGNFPVLFAKDKYDKKSPFLSGELDSDIPDFN